jgi:hypothetical protein
VTANDVDDADAGANNLQNAAVLSAATTTGAGRGHIAGSLNAAPLVASYRVEFFADTPRPLGLRRGRRYLGSANVTTDGAGYAAIAAILTATVTPSVDYVTATVTDAAQHLGVRPELHGGRRPDRHHQPNAADAPDMSSVSALIANNGTDGRISLREAITATNNTIGTHTIRFGIPLTDANHYYYQDDSAPGLSTVGATLRADADITDFDPDYVGTPFSWFRIRPVASELPALARTVTIDGYTQPGARANTVAAPGISDAILKIELDGQDNNFFRG